MNLPVTAEAAELARFAELLDTFDLKPDQRAKIFGAWDRGGIGPWVAARSILLTDHQGTGYSGIPLWQVVLKANPTLAINAAPGPYQILHGLMSAREALT